MKKIIIHKTIEEALEKMKDIKDRDIIWIDDSEERVGMSALSVSLLTYSQS